MLSQPFGTSEADTREHQAIIEVRRTVMLMGLALHV